MSIRLAPFTDEHVEPMSRTILDPDILRFTNSPNPRPPDWLATWRTKFDGVTSFNWAIVDDELAQPGFVGYAVAFGIDREAGEVELGYATSPWARGRGVATATLQLLTEWALAEGFQRVALLIDLDNPASQAVAKRCGYTLEGVLRSMHNRDGSRSDLQSWSLLPDDVDGSRLASGS